MTACPDTCNLPWRRRSPAVAGYDAREIAEFMGLSLREFLTLLQHDVSILGRDGDGGRLQVGLRPIVIVLDLIGSLPWRPATFPRTPGEGPATRDGAARRLHPVGLSCGVSTP